jgi:hypothetical protein
MDGLGVDVFEILRGGAETGIYKPLPPSAHYSSFPHSETSAILLFPKSCTCPTIIGEFLVDIDMSVSFFSFFFENLHAVYGWGVHFLETLQKSSHVL